jgi:hypothetical protein
MGYPDYSNPYSPLNPNQSYFLSNLQGDVYLVVGMIVFTIIFFYYLKKKTDKL